MFILNDSLSADIQGIESTRVALVTTMNRLQRIYNSGEESLSFLDSSMDNLENTVNAIIDGLQDQIDRIKYVSKSIMVANLASSNEEMVITPISLRECTRHNMTFSELDGGIVFESNLQSTVHSE